MSDDASAVVEGWSQRDPGRAGPRERRPERKWRV